MKGKALSDQKKSFKHTLNLPKTDFSIRANAAEKEPQILEEWKNSDLYAKACDKNEGKISKKFILHDGPPFANGHMHMGHALNRILKDIVCKSKRRSGYHVISSPGWDCHGLPIEHKVVKEYGENLDRVTFKKKCREFAQKWIDIQREEIKRLGVVADWDHPYITMSPVYEGAILQCFADFVEKGYIVRKGKTVPWCGSCKTVLATAEIEYQDRKDPSCYILFPFTQEIFKKKFGKIFSDDTELNLLVWTTTPWTIPLNRAVVLHPTASYVVLETTVDEKRKLFIVGERLADKVCGILGIEKKVLATFNSKDLFGEKVQHPYVLDGEEPLQVPIILDDMVLLDDGTACVHSAPGCGPEDYVLGVKNGLEIFSPLSVDGKYTAGIEPKELEGMAVSDGQIWSIKKMAEKGRLLHKTSIKHSYPHCWRCHEPLIFRATDQWFCELKDLSKKAIAAAEKIAFVPDWGKARLSSSIASRTEWCLSRQRQWGVPIPAIICKKCPSKNPYTFLDAKFIRSVAEHVLKEGVEFWDTVTIEDLFNAGMLRKDFVCPDCGNSDLSAFEKEMDILDVWFESGVSHTAAKAQCPALQIPADVYLEGSDQHRGWFQSSLLSSIAMYEKPCTKSFVTHAYVLDAEAQKMSKSKGNVVSPQDVIKKYSADILRLWVAASDFEGNIVISEESLKNVSEAYRKIRNTCRFMLSNLYDFDSKKDALSVAELSALDQHALAELQNVIKTVKEGYETFSFTSVFRTLNEYCNNGLSAFYLDIVKDRLYVEKANGHRRRSAQTVIYHILDSLILIMAPVLSFLSEDLCENFEGMSSESVHLKPFPSEIDVWNIVAEERRPDFVKNIEGRLRATDMKTLTFPAMVNGLWTFLEQLRPDVLKAIELKRESKLIKHSLEAKVTIYKHGLNSPVDGSDGSTMEGGALLLGDFVEFLNEPTERFFKDFFIVSQCEIISDQEPPAEAEKTRFEGISVLVEHAEGEKCPRCWQWEVTSDELCSRCRDVVGSE